MTRKQIFRPFFRADYSNFKSAVDTGAFISSALLFLLSSVLPCRSIRYILVTTRCKITSDHTAAAAARKRFIRRLPWDLIHTRSAAMAEEEKQKDNETKVVAGKYFEVIYRLFLSGGHLRN
jgi:hypothetical protein